MDVFVLTQEAGAYSDFGVCLLGVYSTQERARLAAEAHHKVNYDATSSYYKVGGKTRSPLLEQIEWNGGGLTGNVGGTQNECFVITIATLDGHATP